MTLSIIIPAYNAEPYIEHLIQRLKPQINDDVEVIVVDDGSDFPYLAPYDWVQVIRQKNKGLAGARNTGLKKAKGNIIAFIDADDLVSENYVSYIQSRASEDWDYMDLSWRSLEDQRFMYRLTKDTDSLPNPSACTRVFRRNFIGDLTFNEKRDVAEDEDFTRRLDLKRGKRICAPEFMYFYRVNTPNSLSKQYRDGLTSTKRIVYYFSEVRSDDTELLEEVRKDSIENEVVILTNNNHMPELEWYAKIYSPMQTWAHIRRGEPTNLITIRREPMKTQVIIYTKNTYKIGGIESFIYNFCSLMHKYYDIMVLYENADQEQIARLLQMVPVKRYSKAEVYDCDTLIINRIFDTAPNNIHAKQMVQMVHGCKAANPWNIPTDKGHIVCVSEAVKESFGAEAENATVIRNMVEKQDTRDMLILVSATRLDTPEKGQDRMVQLANMMRRKNIPFVWFVFSNYPLKNIPEGVIMMNPTLNIREYIKKADYVVQLSDTEAFCYTLVESLLEGTPLICTDLPVLAELGIKDGENAHVLPMDLSEYDVTKLLDVPSFSYTYNNGLIVSKWKKLLGNTKPTGSYKPEPTRIVQIIQQYRDIELNRTLSIGEVVTMSVDRALKVQEAGYGIIKEG